MDGRRDLRSPPFPAMPAVPAASVPANANTAAAKVAPVAASLVLLVAAAGALVLPIVGRAPLAKRAYTMALQCALFVHGTRAAKQHAPAGPVWPLGQYVQKWRAALPPLVASTDFQYAFAAFVFALVSTSRPISITLVPFAVLALYHTVTFFNANLGTTTLWRLYGKRLFEVLRTYQQHALLLNAQCEIAVLPLSLLHALIPDKAGKRQTIFTVLLYAQYLRLRYASADAKKYHHALWSRAYGYVAPLAARVPYGAAALDRLCALLS